MNALRLSYDTSLLTVVIPALNEQETILEVISSVRPYAGQVIVVDGHSTDATAAVAKQAGVELVYDSRLGKGDAIRVAIPFVRGEVAVFIDADGSHDAQDIPKLVLPILNDQYDLVIGSRLLGGSSELHGGFDEFFRLTGSAFITACINCRYKVRLSDSQNGFRALRTSALRRLGLRENKTTIEQEMIMKALQKGFRVGEAPAHEYPRKAGYSKIRLSKVWFWYGWSLLRGLLAL